VAEASGVRHVYGEPIERNGTLVIPAARVATGGGAGGGGGTEPGARAEADAQRPEGVAGTPGGTSPDRADDDTGSGALGEGGGGGFGFGRRAEPAGAIVMDDQGVRWVPAVDVNRIVLGGQIAFVLAVAAIGWAVARRRRRR
jgi:uncharacterized spore protein YtfJ